jgi:hypothetical protein
MIQAAASGLTGSDTLTITFPTPSSTYMMGPAFASGGIDSMGIVMGDFNGDNKLDIATANGTAETIAVFLNDGTGNFGAPVVTTLALPELGALSVGDFNEDGKADLVVSTIDGGNQANFILLGNGDGTFQAPSQIPGSGGFFRAIVADLNGDGHQDLVFGANGNVSVSLGKGDGTFSDPTLAPLMSGSFPGSYRGIAVGDFNGDGKLDIVAADTGSLPVGNLVFYPGNGDGTFGTPTSHPLDSDLPVSIASGDFNGDGKQDIVVAFTLGAGISDAAVGDLNGDGTLDVAVINNQTGQVSVILSQPVH